MLSLLDDFLVIEAQNKHCADAHNELLCLLQKLGFSINWDKVVAPSQCLTFLGIEINSISRQLSLPWDKMKDLNTMLSSWLKTFLRCLIDLMCSLKCKHYHVRLSAEARADITWWANFMFSFNGTVQFMSNVLEPVAYLTSDACLEGGAAVYNHDSVQQL